MSVNKTNNLQKNELITKLEKISSLYNKAVLIQEKIDNFVPEDNYERKIIVPDFPGQYKNNDERKKVQSLVNHKGKDAINRMAGAYDNRYAPKQPAQPKIRQFNYQTDSETKKKQDNFKLYSIISAGVGIFFFLGILLGTADEAWFTILAISIVCAVLSVFFRGKMKKEMSNDDKRKAEFLAEFTRQNEEIQAQYKAKLKVYENECAAYQQIRQEFLNNYTSWREIYLKSVSEKNEIKEKLEQDRIAAVHKIDKEELTPVIKELSETNDLFSNEYLPVIDDIINLITSGRADNVKEAINLYEEIVYRERQLQLEREMEEQRQYEEELRRQEEEQRYQEEKRFREEQEWNRQREEKERQRREDERQAREMEAKRRDEQNAKYEAKSRCHWCTNWRHCGVKRNPPLYCPNFQPGDTHQI